MAGAIRERRSQGGPWERRIKAERTMVHLSSEVKKIADCLEKDERISAAYVLGSAVTGRLRTGSDIDIALLPAPDRSLSQMDVLHLHSELGTCCPRPVDIGILIRI